ncbi:MAG: DNA polymerase III subunit alpha, partial [Acidobacteriota bacterium]
IGTGKTIKDPNRLQYGSPKYYFRSAAEMWEVFGEEPDLLLRTLEIAEKCDLEFPKPTDQLPQYPVPAEHTISSYFEKVTRDGFDERCREVFRPLGASLKHSLSTYEERLAREMDIINRMGYAGYFLIVWDFIRYARTQGIPVGPGRGSAAGSLVAYCLKITDVDPIQYDLLFERFLNPERVNMPDIDVDFCVRGRASVIEYVSGLYGRENVSQIITFGTMASRAVIKDVGRAMEIPLAEVEKVAKMIPPPVRGRNVSIKDAIEQNPDFRAYIDSREQVAELIEIAQRLEGCARHSSVHAAGVVISPVPISDLVPVCLGQNKEVTTQFVMSDLEKTGLLKMDFLALTTLTIIEDCLKSIESESGTRPDLSQIPLDDEKALRLFADGHLNAVFQFESTGMVEICRKLRPESLEDLSALNALYRPGPIDGGMIDDYIDRRHGRKKVEYLVPQMKDILENTYGILVYQEQIMLLAQELAGYSMGEADLMRRAMGKKKKEEMAQQKQKFIGGARARGMSPAKAENIFDLMANFADYGFNRSHSFAYAFVAYQTAFLKAHYPAHFFASVLSNERDNTVKLSRYINEMKVFGLQLLPPDINSSNEGFTPVGSAIRFGLAAIKGIGVSTVNAIIAARAEAGLYRSVFDVAERVDQRVLNRRAFESLAKAGAFDTVNLDRARVFAAIEKAMENGARVQRDRLSGQSGLFFETVAADHEPELPAATAWGRREALAFEKETLGLYVSGHPLESFVSLLAGVINSDCGSLAERETGDQVSLGGIITDLTSRLTKKGDRFALFRLEDQFGGVKVICWPEQFNKFKNELVADRAVVLKGRLEISDDGTASVFANDIQSLELARLSAARSVCIRCREEDLSPKEIDALLALCEGHSGETRFFLEVATADYLTVRLRPAQFRRIDLSSAFTEGLKTLNNRWDVELIVGRNGGGE